MSSCFSGGARRLWSACGQLVGIKSALGAVQLRVLDALPRMWVSGSGSERRGALLYGSAAWVDFQSHPEKKVL